MPTESQPPASERFKITEFDDRQTWPASTHRQLLMQFFDRFEEAILVFDARGTIVYANPSIARRLGRPQEVLMGRSITDLFAPPPTGVDALITAMRSDAGPPLKMITRQGRRIPVDAWLTHARWRDGEVLIGFFRDVSQRLATEKAYRESERRIVTLMESLPGLAYRCRNNCNWTMIYVSPGCIELTGYRPDEFIADRVVSWASLIHPDDLPYVREAVGKALDSGQFYRVIFRIITAAGEEKWVWEQGCGIPSDNGEIHELEGFITDITEQHRAKRKLHRENTLLKSKMIKSYRFCNIVGRSRAMQAVFDQILRAAESPANAIIYGESGTGKELVARAIHDMSDRHAAHFVPVNCGAIPTGLIESEFFGYKKGAFTGAMADKPGFLDLADGGTLFLDEVGEIDPNLQVKLLRAVEGKGYTPVGGSEVKKPGIRIIASTHRDLAELVEAGAIRSDFYYRIHVIPIHVPPLRERMEDLPLLVCHFLKQFGYDDRAEMVPADVIGQMQSYDWPGNIRELQNVVQRYVTMQRLDFMPFQARTAAAPQATGDPPSPIDTDLPAYLARIEKRIIRDTLEKNRWHRGHTAVRLGISYRTLLRKIKELDISRQKS